MKISLPITKQRISSHFMYGWWQYVLLVVIAVFTFNILYTTTKYRSPEHLVVEWYYEGGLLEENEKKVSTYLETVKQNKLSSMEVVELIPTVLDDTYGSMQLMTWVSGGQGDLFQLTPTYFKQLASTSAVIDLQPYIDNGSLQVQGISLENGYVTETETGNVYLKGIPTDQLTSLSEYGIANKKMFLSVLANGGNVDNTIILLNELIRTMKQ